ncbi:MAG: hypothetical protein QOF33_2074 [Thermomicrobiales bacterium]|jgi:hypothetical protein|nr:hypothetical protein [Thermomicrobiales bacterium]MEA2583989.1 hypothetical protein [Thermomicrobiales bacterium]MEA2598382.1 hypothetical protein [Thermomicrobiales bacterium]
MQTSASGSLIGRMMGAARLDAATYEEVERDTNATTQAAIVVVLAAIASGIGALGDDDPGKAFIAGVVGGILGWIVFAAAAYVVGTKLLSTAGTEADLGQLMRTIGFAYTPYLLNVVGFIPVLGWIVGLIAGIWVIVTTVVALRHALEMSTGRAIVTAIISAILAAIALGIVYAIFDVSTPGT